MIEIKKLDQDTHGKTRKLWEHIFREDTKAFLDYYYDKKTAENEIFVVEKEDDVIAMLQLNPYHMHVNEKIYKTNYIVAVSTHENYRKQGIMGNLLTYAMKEMYSRKEPFTFLMPAAEAIYYPYDFRFIYCQGRSKVTGLQIETSKVEILEADTKDCEEIALFAESVLSKFSVVTKRDARYYEVLLEEQKSEGGGILMLKKNHRLSGVVCYAKEKCYEIREPLVESEEDLRYAVYYLTENEKESIECLAYGKEQQVPVIMARILHLETFLRNISLCDDVDFYMKVRDCFLEQNNQVFHIVGTKEQGVCLVDRICEHKGCCMEISMGDLTSFLFGCKTEEELDTNLQFVKELKKFLPLSKVFINEVV